MKIAAIKMASRILYTKNSKIILLNLWSFKSNVIWWQCFIFKVFQRRFRITILLRILTDFPIGLSLLVHSSKHLIIQ